jgi:long-subunit acyl-CoA synthetase (AMP-forming)
MNQPRPHQQLDRPLGVPYASVGALFRARVDEHRNKTFLISPGTTEETFTYSALETESLRAVSRLRELGLAKGDRFNLIIANSPLFLHYYFAGLTIGATVVPINPDLSAQEMTYIIRDSQSKVVFFDPALGARIGEAREQAGPAVRFEDITVALGNRAAPTRVEDPNQPHDEAIIIYTSGTSGNPKGVILSHNNLLADAKAIAEWFQFSGETRTLCIQCSTTTGR